MICICHGVLLMHGFSIPPKNLKSIIYINMKSIVTELTTKQQLFCDEYLKDMNASAAALRAGYSAGTALNGQLMQLPKVKHYLQQRTTEVVKKVRVSQEMVLAELAKIAFSNMGDYFADDGSMKPMHEVASDAKAALWSLSVSDAGSGAVAGRIVGDNTNNGHNRQECSGRTVKFRMYNKLSALKEIAKHIGFYKPEDVKPEVEHVLITPEDLKDDDLLDDEALQEFLEDREEFKGKNSESKNQQLEGDRQDRDLTDAVDDFDPDAARYDEDGNILCDGAGIPYGPLPAVVAVDNVKEKPVVVEPVSRPSAFKIHATAFPTNHPEYDAALKCYFVSALDLSGMSLKEKSDLLNGFRAKDLNTADLAVGHKPGGLR